MSNTISTLNAGIIPLNIQSAAQAMQNFQRLAELRGLSVRNADIDAEQANVEKYLNDFTSQHSPALINSYLQVSTVLAPLQRSMGAILGPIISQVLAEMLEQGNAKNEEVK